MMIARPLLFLGFALGLAPQIASAALSLQIGPKYGTGPANDDLLAFTFPPGAEQFFDIVFNETGTPENEGLFAYDLLIQAPQGINLLRAEKPDNWVFTAPDASFNQAEADARHILVNGINTLTGALSDITRGSKVARVYFTRTADMGVGLFNITLDPNVTAFGSGDPACDLVIPVDISDAGVILGPGLPEPSGLALFAFGSLLFLRRRRAALSLE